jgi:hypothetical protein
MKTRLDLYLRWIGIPFILYMLFGTIAISLYKLGGCTGALGSGIKCMNAAWFGSLALLFEVSMIFSPVVYFGYFILISSIFCVTYILSPPSKRPPNIVKISKLGRTEMFLGGISVVMILFVIHTQLRFSFYEKIAKVSSLGFFCKGASQSARCYGSIAGKRSDISICSKLDSDWDVLSCMSSFGQNAESVESCDQLVSSSPMQGTNNSTDLRKNYMGCIGRFPESSQTQKVCRESWSNENFDALVDGRCWRAIDPNAQSPVTGNSFLMMFVRKEKLGDSVYHELLDLTEDVNAQNRLGDTALSLMNAGGLVDQKFLSRKPRADIKNSRGLTPPMYWAETGNLENFLYFEKYLKENQWNAREELPSGDTVMHLFAKRIQKSPPDFGFAKNVYSRLVYLGGVISKPNKSGITADMIFRKSKDW